MKASIFSILMLSRSYDADDEKAMVFLSVIITHLSFFIFVVFIIIYGEKLFVLSEI